LAKQETTFSRELSLSPGESPERELLRSLVGLSRHPTHQALPLDEVTALTLTATFDREQNLETLRLNLLSSRKLPFVILKGGELTGLQGAVAERLFQVLERPLPTLAHQASEPRNATLGHSIPDNVPLSSGIKNKLVELMLEKEKLELEFGEGLRPELIAEKRQRFGLVRATLSTYDDYLEQLNTCNALQTQLTDRSKHSARESAKIKEREEVAFERLSLLEDKIRKHLRAASPDHEKNALIEIRAGSEGGDMRYIAVDRMARAFIKALSPGFKVELIESEKPTHSWQGGSKTIVLRVEGPGAYGLLRHESGTHKWEINADKVVTAGLSVVVMPEQEASDFELDLKDLKFETTRSSGHGGQNVNKTESAVKATHIPSGRSVEISTTPSQRLNKEAAIRLLRSRLSAEAKQSQHDHTQDMRREKRGHARHADAIRTYKEKDGLVRDHRLIEHGGKSTVVDYDECMDGGLLGIIRRVEVLQFDLELEASTD